MNNKVLSLFTTLLFLFKGASCSFKKSDEKRSQNISNYEVNAWADTDGDTITDIIEKNNGTDPFVANVPEFDGEFFEEMKVTTHLYELGANKSNSLSFQVRKNIVRENGTAVEERDFLSYSRQFIIEQNNLLAERSGFKSSYHAISLRFDNLGLYSAPRMNDLKIFPFSQKLQESIERQEFEEMEILTSNRIKFKYHKPLDYSDLVIDLYWYNQTNKELVLFGTTYLSGSYQFNKDYHVQTKFINNNPQLIREIAMGGGRFLYLKVRDFKIIQSNLFYSKIIESIKEKCVGFLTYDGEKEKLRFVASPSRFMNISEILKKGTGEEILITGQKLSRIGIKGEETTLNRNPYGENEVNRTFWHILTGEINNNPFNYSFAPGDVISINYVQDKANDGIIPSYFSSIISSNSSKEIKTIKVLSPDLKNIRLNLAPHWVKSLHTSVEKLLPCPNSNLERFCWNYRSEEKSLKGVQALPLMGLIELRINNKSFRLDDLINKKLAKYRIKNSQIIEIKFQDSLLMDLEESKGLSITFLISPKNSSSCEGIKICESSDNQCEVFYSTPPKCEDQSKPGIYSIINQIRSVTSPIHGEGFMSIEYL